jgi:hypothetical protein
MAWYEPLLALLELTHGTEPLLALLELTRGTEPTDESSYAQLEAAAARVVDALGQILEAEQASAQGRHADAIQ